MMTGRGSWRAAILETIRANDPTRRFKNARDQLRSVPMKGPAFALGLVVLLSSCQIDEPNPIPPPGSSTPKDHLSQLGIFQGPLAALTPAPGVIPYDINVPLYSDGAQKRRFMILPPTQRLAAPVDDTTDRWVIPAGTYFVKNFFFPNDARDQTKGIHLVETRFLVRTAEGYLASTYLWNTDQTDAIVSGGNVDVPVQWIDEQGVQHAQSFHVPGTSYCQDCHDQRALGIRTRQMDLAGAFSDGSTNQIDFLMAEGVLDARPPAGVTLSDPTGTGPMDGRARSYLDANCAHCHAERGLASGTRLYLDYEHTDPSSLASLAICRQVPAVAGRDRVIVPGHPEQSEFLARMESPDPFVRMPLGPIRIPDGAGIAVLSEWVTAMSPAGCP